MSLSHVYNSVEEVNSIFTQFSFFYAFNQYNCVLLDLKRLLHLWTHYINNFCNQVKKATQTVKNKITLIYCILE